jgi:prepilin-type N-terminal cleavage/methylation domain-containing protein
MKHQRNRGFTLIELLVGLAILSVLALLAGNAFDGARSKAQAMLGLMRQVGDANIMLKNDTGCYVNRADALFNAEAANTASYNYCGRSFGKAWSRPYLGRQEFNSTTGAIRAEKVGSGVEVSLRRENGGLGRIYFIRAENVPNDVIRQALIECLGDDEGNPSFPANKCRAQLGSGTSEVGTFDMIYDETR